MAQKNIIKVQDENICVIITNSLDSVDLAIIPKRKEDAKDKGTVR